MELPHFDHVARIINGDTTRRSALGFVSGLGLGSLLGITDDAEAKKKKKKKKKHKKPQAPPADTCKARVSTVPELLAALQVAARDTSPEPYPICLAAGTYVLPVPTADIYDIELQGSSLIGAGATQTILHGSGSGFSAVVGNLFSAAMRDLTVTGGASSPSSGGGITNTGALILTNVIVRDNSAGYGGGIFTNGELTLDGCTITGNTATTETRAGRGGGVLNYDTIVQTNTTISGNSADLPGTENCLDDGGTGC